MTTHFWKCKAFLPVLLLLLLLCGCAGDQTAAYTVETDGTVYTVDTAHNTISDGMYTYDISISGTQITITYPDGSSYCRSYMGNGVSTSSWDQLYGSGPYTDAETLLRVLEKGQSRSSNSRGRYAWLGLLLLAAGIANAAAPRFFWQLRYGWHYKDAEPSDTALTVGRMGGAAAALLGLVLLLV